MAPIFSALEYKEYSKTEVRKLTSEEVEKYMKERKASCDE